MSAFACCGDLGLTFYQVADFVDCEMDCEPDPLDVEKFCVCTDVPGFFDLEGGASLPLFETPISGAEFVLRELSIIGACLVSAEAM